MCTGRIPRYVLAVRDPEHVGGKFPYSPFHHHHSLQQADLTPWKAHRNHGRNGDPVDNEDAVDVRDVGTPDDWVRRDGRMVRLTGRHPFNAEPPLAVLSSTEMTDTVPFLTLENLHIIRSHAAVPKLSWDTHRLVIQGPMMKQKDDTVALSMDQLVQDFAHTEFPVTVSCCGNRRKEINMIKQTIGFNWGAAAVGNCVYQGVLVRDLLIATAHVPADDPSSWAGWHVEFLSHDAVYPNKAGGPGPFPDHPWGESGPYGTSIPLEKAMSLADEVMVAYACNGQRLRPDRGFPCRLIIPGYIGGRMVKWLGTIRVIPHESRK